ncbi:hypothetical protein [Methylomonas albis]|uniref:Uncharacterized protein n=2 Tax=Methylomonas albis TaxID=1854563 RepID=A0ABR9D5V7_9GAMM|nr:hypothetical protein [Methylomonas albis]CAD6880980.1 hypothetical protein [Methylomonas albis]
MVACSKANRINARSLQSAQKSVFYIKEHLPQGERIPFEVSYWLLRDQIKNNEEFLKTIEGKTAKELVDLGKDNFTKRKASGDTAYAQYENWEQMISKSAQQPSAQESADSADPRDKKGYPSVDYKMHSM